MTRVHQNVEEMLLRLTENSKKELDLIRALGDAIRRVDEQLLREVHAVTVQHEIRREAILGELQDLAARLCALPARSAASASVAAIDQHVQVRNRGAVDATEVSAGGADWRQAAQNVDDEFEFVFALNRH